MQRAGYQLLGFAVWKGAMWYLRRRFGDTPKKLAAGGLVALVIAVLLVVQRRAANSD